MDVTCPGCARVLHVPPPDPGWRVVTKHATEDGRTVHEVHYKRAWFEEAQR